MSNRKFQNVPGDVLAIQFVGGFESAKEIIDWLGSYEATGQWVGETPRYTNDQKHADALLRRARRDEPAPEHIFIDTARPSRSYFRGDERLAVGDWIVYDLNVVTREEDKPGVFEIYTHAEFTIRFRRPREESSGQINTFEQHHHAPSVWKSSGAESCDSDGGTNGEKSSAQMTSSSAPPFTLAYIGARVNGVAIVKTRHGYWRRVDTGTRVDEMDFRGGWDPL